jgi:hypothetical protein
MNIRKASVIKGGISKGKFLLFYIAHCIIREITYPTTCKKKMAPSQTHEIYNEIVQVHQPNIHFFSKVEVNKNQL